MKMMKELMMAATAACALGFASSAPASDPVEAEKVAEWKVTWQESKPALTDLTNLTEGFTTKTGFYLYNEDRIVLAVLTCEYTPPPKGKNQDYKHPVIKRKSLVVDSWDRNKQQSHGVIELDEIHSHIVYTGDNTLMPRIAGVSKKGDVYIWLPDGDFTLTGLSPQIDISQRLVKIDREKDSSYKMVQPPLELSNSRFQVDLLHFNLFEFMKNLLSEPRKAIDQLVRTMTGSLEIDMVSVSEKNVYVNRFKLDKPEGGQPLEGDNWFELFEPESLRTKGTTTSLKFKVSDESVDTPSGFATVDHPKYMFQEKMSSDTKTKGNGTKITTKTLEVLVYR